MSQTEVFISDMSHCTPKESILEGRIELGKWLVCPYETEDFEGKLLFAGPHNDVPAVRLPMDVKGWYKIYIGTHYGDCPDSIAVSQSTGLNPLFQLRLKLSNDPCYHWITPERYLAGKEGTWPEHRWSAHDLVEVYWRKTELDGGYIEFLPTRWEEGYRHTSACIAYVRLVPMGQDEIDEYQADSNRTDTRRLIGVYDGAFWGHYPWTKEQMREFVEPLRASDFRAIAWSTSRADTVQYDSKRFETWQGPPTPAVKPYYNARDLHRAFDAGLDPLQCMSDICHEMGLELLGSMRISSQHLPPHQNFCPNPYLWSRPHNRVRNAEGRPTGHLSLASAEVRQRLTDVFREQVEDYDLDGVHVMFNRSYPFVLFEEPARGDFRKQYGEDPVEIDPRDERWLKHKATYVMQFLQGIRDMLDAVGQSKGKRLKLALHVMSCPRHNRFYGLDLEPFIQAGHLDYLLPHPTYSFELAHVEKDEGHGPCNVGHHSVTPERVAEWKEITKGTNCLLYPDVFPRRKPANEFRKQGLSYYQAGADGLSFHDLYWRIHRKSEWAMLAKLGHAEEMGGWEDRCNDYFRTRKLISMNGCSMDKRYNPGTCG